MTSCNANITTVARFCRIVLYNIRRIWPFLSCEAAQILVQVLIITHLDYCNPLLAGSPASAIKPLQRIQNAAARLVFNLPEFSPLFRDLHWLLVIARIRFKTLVLAYRAVRGTAPTYLKTFVRPYEHAQAQARLVPPSLRTCKVPTLLWSGTAVFEKCKGKVTS